jgi:hypothetical protein
VQSAPAHEIPSVLARARLMAAFWSKISTANHGMDAVLTCVYAADLGGYLRKRRRADAPHRLHVESALGAGICGQAAATLIA